MGEYKFLDRKYIDRLLGGEILFRRLIYYRLLEVVTQDQWIGDASEGVARTAIDYALVSPADPKPTLRRKLEEARLVKMDDNSTVKITNMTLTAEVDCFVFCFSSGDLTRLAETMCATDKPEYAYDGCVSILDPTVLAQAIYDSGKLGGRPIRDNFSVTVGPVSYYEAVAQDFLTGGMPSADPFKKDRRYAAQREMRIVLMPRNPIESDSAVVIVDKPDTLFREEFCPLPIGKKVAAPYLIYSRFLMMRSEFGMIFRASPPARWRRSSSSMMMNGWRPSNTTGLNSLKPIGHYVRRIQTRRWIVTSRDQPRRSSFATTSATT
jgi:hypothetical protein